MDLAASFSISAPELIVILAALAGVTAGAILGDSFSKLAGLLGAGALAAAGVVSFLQMGAGPVSAWGGVYGVDSYVLAAKCFVYLLAAAALLMSAGYLAAERLERYEYAILLMLATSGMGMMLSARDLTTLYLGIELLSISSYVLAAFNRDSKRAAEAGLKYFILGALASGLMLYGMSLVYGFSGSLRYETIADAEMSVGLIFGMVLMICGFAFKSSAAPFHMWTPDVYQGAPTPVVAFFASAPKLAAVMVFAIVLFTAFGDSYDQWRDVVAIIAAASMMVGAIGALIQTNIKRLLAYSSISNVGFALMAVAAGREDGAAAALVYMTIYAISALGLFACVLSMRRSGGMVEDVKDLSGLAQSQPLLAMAWTALVFSVAGIPPLFGFLGKRDVFLAALDADLVWLVIVGVIAAVLALGYYLRLVKTIWVDEAGERFAPAGAAVGGAIAVTAATAGLGLILLAGPLSAYARAAAAGLIP